VTCWPKLVRLVPSSFICRTTGQLARFDEHGQPGWQLHLAPAEEEQIIRKCRDDGFAAEASRQLGCLDDSLLALKESSLSVNDDQCLRRRPALGRRLGHETIVACFPVNARHGLRGAEGFLITATTSDTPGCGSPCEN